MMESNSDSFVSMYRMFQKCGNIVKGKGEVNPMTGHEGPEVE
jgi:hypothetical protein